MLLLVFYGIVNLYVREFNVSLTNYRWAQVKVCEILGMGIREGVINSVIQIQSVTITAELLLIYLGVHND